MIDKKILLLHIGMPKSGTTSLQGFLFKNADRLKKYGWCYPDLIQDMAYLTDERYDEGEKNGLCLRRSIIKNWSRKKTDILWEDILNYLKHDNVIISDEILGASTLLDTEKSLAVFKSYYDNIKVILYLRRQDLFIESLWNQDVKRGLNGETISDFVKSSPYLNEFADYLSRIRGIEKIIGRENMIIKVFEREQLSGKRADIISDFLETLNTVSGSEIREDGEWTFPERLNLRLDGNKLWIKMLFNREYKRHTQTRNEIVNEVFVQRSGNNREKYGYFTREEREEILNKYKEDNEIIARDYLKRTDGRLFYNMDTDIAHYIPDITDREKEIIELFAQIIYEEEKKFSKLGREQTGIKNGLHMCAVKSGKKLRDTIRKPLVPFRLLKLRKNMEEATDTKEQ